MPTEGNAAINVIAHAILGAAVAALQGNNAAAGAATGELAARAIAGALYSGVENLSEEQKQTISTLATISAGMVGGIAGNCIVSSAVRTQGGENAVENILFSDSEEAQTEWITGRVDGMTELLNRCSWQAEVVTDNALPHCTR